MTTVAVVAHAGKSFGGGLLQLRRELERQGVSDPRSAQESQGPQ